MQTNYNLSFGMRFCIASAAFIIIVAGMRAAEPILVPFLLSIFIAIIAAPPLFWLENRKVPIGLAVLIVISVVLIMFLLIFKLVGASINDFTQTLPVYKERLKDETGVLIQWLENAGVSISGQELLKYVNPGEAMQMASNTLSGFSSALSNGFLILFTVIFILTEASSFPIKLRKIYGGKSDIDHFYKFLSSVQNYMAIKTAISLFTGLFIAIWLKIIGVDYPLLWGLLAFLLNYVPNIGSIIAAVPAVLLAFVQLGSGSAIMTAAGFITVNFVIGNIVEPRFMGKGLGLSTLVVFLSLVFWGWVLGPVGMLLSVPLTMTVKIALDNNPETQWLAILLGPSEEEKSEEATEDKAKD